MALFEFRVEVPDEKKIRTPQDVLEYHLGGARYWSRRGAVSFVEDNLRMLDSYAKEHCLEVPSEEVRNIQVATYKKSTRLLTEMIEENILGGHYELAVSRIRTLREFLGRLSELESEKSTEAKR